MAIVSPCSTRGLTRGLSAQTRRTLPVPSTSRSNCGLGLLRRSHVCRAEDNEGPSDADKAKDLENAFAAEIRRRGMEGGSQGTSGPEAPRQAKDPFTATRARAPPPPKATMDGTQDQRQRSMNMVNEGLEGLLPRVSQLFQLGGSIFLAFLPFMLVFSLLFSGIYVVFGDSFLHRGYANSGPREYLDPDRLLSESTVDPYIPFQK